MTRRVQAMVLVGLAASATGCQIVTAMDYSSLDAASCTPGLSPCDGVCLDLKSSPEHCGGCNRACTPFGQVCSNGVCGCRSGSTPCGSVCALTLSDPTNCGTCGNVCRVGTTCTNGMCVCDFGTVSCPDGCFDTAGDSLHCGSCDRQCASNQRCVEGLCKDLVQCPSPPTSVGAPGEKACGTAVCNENELCCVAAMSACASSCSAGAIRVACDGPEDCAASGGVCCGVPDLGAIGRYLELVCEDVQRCVLERNGNIICHPALTGQCELGCEQSQSLACGYGSCVRG